MRKISGRFGAMAGITTLMGMVLAAAIAAPAKTAETSQAGTYGLLYSFQCGSDGETPDSGLVRDSAGNLYGTTTYGGSLGYGTLFKVTAAGAHTVLHTFAGPPDGESPGLAGLTLDAAGNVYGTTYHGGTAGYGVVFKWTAAAGTESVLYSFTGGTDGAYPDGGMVRDTAGNLYGTTYFGGTSDGGVVFKLTPSGGETVLYNFTNGADGDGPIGNLLRDSAGNFYGTTENGGASSYGTVFEVSTDVETVLHSFTGHLHDGENPCCGVSRDAAGNLYGVTTYGGATRHGTIFEVTPTGVETVLLSFNGTTDGAYPSGGLAQDAGGNLYGTTRLGGSPVDCGSVGCGVLFKLSASGKEMTLHTFSGDATDGDGPFGGLVRDPAGNLYGTLSEGGASFCGAVFKFTP